MYIDARRSSTLHRAAAASWSNGGRGELEKILNLLGEAYQGSDTLVTNNDRAIQPDQKNMVVYIWYLVKSDLSSVSYCTRVRWTGHFLQGTRKKRPCLTGHSVHRLIHFLGR